MNTQHFFIKNWYKILIVGLLLFICLKKDFSFHVNLNNPNKIEQPSTNNPTPTIPQPSQELKKEKLTDNQMAKTITERFEMPFLSSSAYSPHYKAFLQADQSKVKEYIKRFAKVAVAERDKYRIPASIVLANALLYSHVGQRLAAVQGENHFQLTCTSDWQGDTQYIRGDCFRAYESAWTSFRDHSLYLTTGKWSHLTQLGRTNYKAWAKAMEKQGFGENKNLKSELIEIIEQYRLYDYDKL